jgi:hypothetical protein
LEVGDTFVAIGAGARWLKFAETRDERRGAEEEDQVPRKLWAEYRKGHRVA